MRDQLNRPKRFGEVLDLIFILSRRHFMDFLKVFLIILGPIILLEMIFQLSMGYSLFRDIAPGETWFEQIINTFGDEDILETSLQESFANLIIISLTSFFGTFATIALLYIIDHIRKGEEYELSDVIKRAFARFLPVIISFALLFAFLIGLFILIGISIFILALIFDSLPGILAVLFIIALFILIAAVMIYFSVRLSFFLAKIAFGRSVFHSFQESWLITRGRVLFVFGIYFLLILIIGIVSNVFEGVLGFSLGNSVLFNLLINLITLITTMIATVGYAVVYFDLQSRHDASDIKTMLEEYDQQ